MEVLSLKERTTEELTEQLPCEREEMIEKIWDWYMPAPIGFREEALSMRICFRRDVWD